MVNSFIDLGISPPILKAIGEIGFESPTEVQSRAIPHILNKEDVIVMSKTGSGKTAVFGIPVLQLTDPADPGPQGLILTPTRELAVQVDNDLRQFSKHLKHKTYAVYGQHSINIEIQALQKGVSIVTGTPGRVFDHISNRNLITKNIRFLVLDEADRMLDMGFIDQVVKIVRTLPKDRVTLLFSATIPPEIHRICAEYMKNPQTIEIESQTKTVDTIQQTYYRVDRSEKRTQLFRLLMIEQPESCIIFCNTRAAVDQIQNFLTRKGINSQALHGDIPQAKRLKTMQQFKEGKFHLLVATDVAARGIHIDDLSLVINYDVPVEKDSYVHRIGRTGRAGNGGRAVSLVTSDDIISLYEIEEHIGALITESELPSEALLGKSRDSAEKWLKENRAKPNESQGERSQTRPPNREQKKAEPKLPRPPKPQPSKQNKPLAGNNAPKAVQSANTANKVNPANAGPKAQALSSTNPVKPVDNKNASVRVYKHVHSQPAGKEGSAAEELKLPVINPVNEVKEPLLKRIIKRIFGK